MSLCSISILCIISLGLNLVFSLKVRHYEPVLVAASRWTDKSTTSVPAESAIHCASSCQLRRDEGEHVCFQFRFHDGVCQLSGWIPEAVSTTESTVQTWRMILGKFMFSLGQLKSWPKTEHYIYCVIHPPTHN